MKDASVDPHFAADWIAGVRENFSVAATGYDRVARLQQLVGGRLVEKLDYIKLSPQRALDLGCGTGKLAGKLSLRFPKAEIIMADLAIDMLRLCRPARWLRPFRVSRLICASAEQMPLASQTMDLVFSNLMLQWCPDPVSVFREALRVLRPGGVFLFSTFGPDTLKELRWCWNVADPGAHVNEFADMHDVGDGLMAAGFSDPVMEVDYLTQTYADSLALMRDLKMLGAGNVHPGRRHALTGKGRLRDVCNAYEKFRTPDGRIPATFEVVYGHAWCATTVRAGAEREIAVPISAIGRRTPAREA